MKSIRCNDRRASAQRERGGALLEFALAVPLLMLLVIGMIEYGFYYYVSVNAAAAAREGARQCTLVSLGACGQCDPTNAVSYMSSMGFEDHTTADADCSNVSGTFMYTVDVQVDFPTLTGLLPNFGVMPPSGKNGNAIAYASAAMRGQ